LARVGTDWATRGTTAVLAVPSAVIPSERNYLINPAHRDFAKIRLEAPHAFSFDARLLRR
jgi:RES domain-containing protein